MKIKAFISQGFTESFSLIVFSVLIPQEKVSLCVCDVDCVQEPLQYFESIFNLVSVLFDKASQDSSDWKLLSWHQACVPQSALINIYLINIYIAAVLPTVCLSIHTTVRPGTHGCMYTYFMVVAHLPIRVQL